MPKCYLKMCTHLENGWHFLKNVFLGLLFKNVSPVLKPPSLCRDMPGFDDGIDDIDIQYRAPTPDMNKVVNGSRNHLVVATGRQTSICSDYDPFWLIHAHPSMFPYGTGRWVYHLLVAFLGFVI